MQGMEAQEGLEAPAVWALYTMAGMVKQELRGRTVRLVKMEQSIF